MRNRPYGFEIYLVNIKTMRTIAHIFVASSEKLNFMLKFRYSEEAIKIRNNLPLNFVITMFFNIKRWDIFFHFFGLLIISEFHASPDTFNFCRKIIVTSKV